MRTSIGLVQALALTLTWAASGICLGAEYDLIITGRVTDVSTGQGIPDAMVQLFTWDFHDPAYKVSLRTDLAGQYIVRPKAGSGYQYTIRAGTRHYRVNWWERFVWNTGWLSLDDIALTPTDGKADVMVFELPNTVLRGQVPLSHDVSVRVDDPDFFGVPLGTCVASEEDGPGQVSFSVKYNDTLAQYDCFCTFPALGVYRLRFAYQDYYGDVGFTTWVFTVQGPNGNECPVIDAGPDITTEGPASPWFAHLAGSASDPDNGPQPLVVEWSRLSGPGMVGFLNEHDPGTTARFTVAGTYVLELSCRDGECEKTDTVTVEVGGDSAGSVCEPLAYWDLEEGSGLVVQDVSGRGHDGQLLGGVRGGPVWVAGCDGGALQFAGRDDYVDTGITDNLAQWTICCWVSSPAAPAAGPASGPMQRGQNFQMNWNHTDAALRSAAALKVGESWYAASLGVLEATTWYHLAATYDGTSLKAYRNGELITTTACPGTPARESNSLKLARHAAAQFFAGTIDEAYVYPCALSQDQIKALMIGPVMTVREVIDNGVIPDQEACYASLNSGTGTTVNYTTRVLDLYDNGPRGHFSLERPFGVVTKGLRTLSSVDNLSMRVDGILRIPAGQGGDWTFGVNSDDGFTLAFPGHDFSSVTNGELAHLAEGVAIRFAGVRARSDTLGVINLPAGDYPFWLTYHECGFDAQVELFAAPGVRTVFDSDLFRLVGQRNIGAVGVPGLCEEVRMVATKSATALESLADARMALERSGRPLRSVKYPFVNHVDPDTFNADWGWFAGELPFPNDVVRQDDDDVAVQVTGLLDIPADGLYQIGFDSDDGASLRITGENWQSIVADGTGQAAIVGDELVNDTIRGGTFTVGQIALTAGCHAFEAVMFEHTGGCHFVLFGRGVSDWGLPDPAWHLLRVGGASAPADVRGLPQVKLPGTP